MLQTYDIFTSQIAYCFSCIQNSLVGALIPTYLQPLVAYLYFPPHTVCDLWERIIWLSHDVEMSYVHVFCVAAPKKRSQLPMFLQAQTHSLSLTTTLNLKISYFIHLDI